jgi:hypothetical protein
MIRLSKHLSLALLGSTIRHPIPVDSRMMMRS